MLHTRTDSIERSSHNGAPCTEYVHLYANYHSTYQLKVKTIPESKTFKVNLRTAIFCPIRLCVYFKIAAAETSAPRRP